MTTTAYRGTVWKVVWNTNVYVRSGPNRESPKVAELLPNSTVVEIARNGDWMQHSTGWTLTRAGTNVVCSVLFAAPNENTQFAGTKWRVVWGSNVYVRQTTNRESVKIAELVPGQEVIELARDGDWLKHQLGWTLVRAGSSIVMQEVQTEGGSKPMLTSNGPDTAPGMMSSSSPATWKVVWQTNVYVRAAPNRESAKVAELAPGTLVTEISREGDWIRHSLGWSLSKAGNNVCLERMAMGGSARTWRVVWATNVYVRAAPARESAKLTELPPGSKVTELELAGDWVRHSLGWTLTRAGNSVCLEVEGSNMDTGSSAPAKYWKVVWQTNVYVRSGPTRDSMKVAELPPGSILTETGHDGDWIRHSKGWTLAKAGTSVCLAPVEASQVNQQQPQQSLSGSQQLIPPQSISPGPQQMQQGGSGPVPMQQSGNNQTQGQASESGTPTGQSIGDWDEMRSSTGQLFYVNKITKATQSTKPEGTPVEQKLVFNPEVGQLELAKPSLVPRNESNENFFA